MLQLSYQLRAISDTAFALCVWEAFLVLCLARCGPLVWGVREGIRAQVAIGKACEDSRNGIEVPGGNWPGPEWSPGYSRGSIFRSADFFLFFSESLLVMECRVLDVFFCFFAALLLSMVCGMRPEDRFFSNLGSLSNSGYEDISERKKVNLPVFF